MNQSDSSVRAVKTKLRKESAINMLALVEDVLRKSTEQAVFEYVGGLWCSVPDQFVFMMFRPFFVIFELPGNINTGDRCYDHLWTYVSRKPYRFACIPKEIACFNLKFTLQGLLF